MVMGHHQAQDDGEVDLRVANGEADTVMRAIVHALHPLHACVHTPTWDNGSSKKGVI